MATRKCPRCRIKVDSVKDKGKYRWKWSKRKPMAYVCHACECELIAKEKGTVVNYTHNQELYSPVYSFNIDTKVLKKVRRKKKLCPQCHEVTFLIGVCVYGDQPRLLVCSNRCKLQYRKAERKKASA